MIILRILWHISLWSGIDEATRLCRFWKHFQITKCFDVNRFWWFVQFGLRIDEETRNCAIESSSAVADTHRNTVWYCFAILREELDARTRKQSVQMIIARRIPFGSFLYPRSQLSLMPIQDHLTEGNHLTSTVFRFSPLKTDDRNHRFGCFVDRCLSAIDCRLFDHSSNKVRNRWSNAMSDLGKKEWMNVCIWVWSSAIRWFEWSERDQRKCHRHRNHIDNMLISLRIPPARNIVSWNSLLGLVRECER
jgi:hypothetical protein